jgi:predicted nucleotidyltransferase/uncharacterized protein with HEPN domain
VHVEVPQAQIEAFCRKWKIREFALFGSVLRDDFRPDSDVDVLVRYEPNPGHSLFDRMAMEEELAAIFGRKVDLVRRDGVDNPFRRWSILTTERMIYGPSNRDLGYLWDLRETAVHAVEIFGKTTLDEVGRSEMMQLALQRLVDLVQRAAAKLSLPFRQAHPEIDWQALIDMPEHLEIGGQPLDADGLFACVRDRLLPLPGLLDSLKVISPDVPSSEAA